MSRRPLGASLSPADRLVAFETRIREYRDLVAILEVAMEALETCPPRELDRAAGRVRAAVVALQELNARPFRRPETVPPDPAPAETRR